MTCHCGEALDDRGICEQCEEIARLPISELQRFRTIMEAKPGGWFEDAASLRDVMELEMR